MTFEWNPAKAALNYAKHRIDFETASEVFDDPHATIEEDTSVHFEFRAAITGRSRLGILVVVYTERHQDVTRIITARRASRHEQRSYFRAVYAAGGRPQDF